MARNNKRHDPLRKEEIKIVQDRHTETVLQAVMMFMEESVPNAVSKARRYLRDELEAVEVNEKYQDILSQDDILIPDSVLSQNRNPRMGGRKVEGGLLSGGDDGFLSDFSDDTPTTPRSMFTDETEEEPQPAPKKPSLPRKSAPLPSRDPLPTQDTEEQTVPSRRDKRENSLSRKQVRAQEIREAKEEEYNLTATEPATDDAYDFLDAEEDQAKSLLIPDNTGWDDWDEEEDEDLPTKTETANLPIARPPVSNLEEEEGEVISPEELDEMWSFGEIKTTKKTQTVSAKELYEDLF